MKITEKQEFEIILTDAFIHYGPLDVRPEFQFSKARRWRFDYAIPALRLAFEYEGIFSKPRTSKAGKRYEAKSRHLTVGGYSNDCEKYNEAAIAGWTVIRITPKMISDGRAGPQIRRAVEAAVKRKERR